jgi:hypothetical protein
MGDGTTRGGWLNKTNKTTRGIDGLWVVAFQGGVRGKLAAADADAFDAVFESTECISRVLLWLRICLSHTFVAG